MSVIGIVCEFNPFHNGHKYLIDSVKKQDDIVVCVMSGNYVQRGEPAIFPKDIRVEAALQNGVDIILELPFVYATSSAEYFAKNAVRILDSFGCDKITFGTEGATVEELLNIVDIMYDKDFDNKLKKHLEKGINYPSARQLTINEYIQCDISTPNNILALEYIKALKNVKSKMIPVAVSRIGAGYNDDFSVDNIASATHIRNLIIDDKDFERFVPTNTYKLYKENISKGNYLSYEKYDSIFQGVLRLKLNDKSNQIANMAEGLENRIKDAVINGKSLEEIYDNAKTKRYTHSRIRRAILCQVFGVKESDLNIRAPYCRLLGLNSNISFKLGAIVERSELPFIVKYSDIIKFSNKNISHIFEIENKTTDLYNLVLYVPNKCAKEKVYFPKKV